MRGTVTICGLLLLVLAALASPARALDPSRLTSQYHVRSWTTLDGLPSDTLSHVLELDDGRLLLSSYYAPPVLFDGLSFEVLSDQHGRAVMPNAAVAAQSADGVLWLAARELGLRRRLPSGEADDIALPTPLAKAINTLRVDGNERLQIGSRDGLFEIDLRRQPLQAQRAGLDGVDVVSLLRDDRGQLWAGTEQGLYRHHQGRWDSVREAGLDGVRVWALHQDRRGWLWVGTRGRGLLRFDGSQWRHYDSGNGFPYDVVRRIGHDAEGTLWVATAGAGLVRMVGEQLQRLGTREGLGSDAVWWFHFDRVGVLWVGTAGGGFSRISDSGFINWTPTQGLASGFHWGIYRGDDGSHYFAGNNGLTRLRDDRVESLGRPGSGSAAVVISLAEDAAGSLWAGTQGGLFRHAGDRFVALPGVSEGEAVRVLYRDQRQQLWVGANAIYQLQGGRLVADPDPLLGPGAAFHRMGEWGDIQWWAGGRGLLLRQHGQTRLRVGAELGPIRDAWRDPAGGIWLAAQGLWWITGDAPPQQVPVRNGDRQVMLHNLSADSFDGLWVASNQGLRRYSIRQLMRYSEQGGEAPAVRSFDRHDGLISSELNGGGQNSVLRDRDGSLWFAAASGVSRLDPSRVNTGPTPLRAAIARLEAGGRHYPLSPALSLPTGVRRVAIGFTALPAASGPRAHFRYRLQPGDAGWIDAGRDRQALLSELAPGRYRFEVEAWLPDDSSVRSSAAVEFELPPAWHERGAVRLLSLLAGATLLIALPMLHIRALRGQRRELLAAVSEKTAALEKLARTDALTGLANRRAFDQALEQAWQAPPGRGLSLLMIDIDHFKAYNDLLGHPAGDRCLAAVARAVQRCARHPADLTARVGGEEFAVLLPDTPLPAALGVAERIREEVLQAALPHPGSAGGRVSLSIGVALRQPDQATAEALTLAADQALYDAKHGGRDRIAVAAVG